MDRITKSKLDQAERYARSVSGLDIIVYGQYDYTTISCAGDSKTLATGLTKREAWLWLNGFITAHERKGN